MAEYIEREALLNDLEKSIVVSCKTENIPQVQRALSKIINCIKDQPTADVAEVRYGKWIEDRNQYTCSECGYYYFANNVKDNFCARCGAKMDKERENNA